MIPSLTTHIQMEKELMFGMTCLTVSDGVSLFGQLVTKCMSMEQVVRVQSLVDTNMEFIEILY